MASEYWQLESLQAGEQVIDGVLLNVTPELLASVAVMSEIVAKAAAHFASWPFFDFELVELAVDETGGEMYRPLYLDGLPYLVVDAEGGFSFQYHLEGTIYYTQALF